MVNSFSQYVSTFFPGNVKKIAFTLHDQYQLPFILDTLSCKDSRHLLINGPFCSTYNHNFLGLIAQAFADERIPKILRESCFVYFDIKNLIQSNITADQFKKDFQYLCQELEYKYSRVILAINDAAPLLCDEHNTLQSQIGKMFKALLVNKQWRFVLTNSIPTLNSALQNAYQDYFTQVNLSEPTTTDALAILKSSREEFENFHQIVIPDEAFAYAYAMSTHYLSGYQSKLDKALQLLDSSAARASTQERTDEAQHKPILTNMTIAQVVSHWTQIPLSHLQLNKFKAADFIQNMQKQLFGQETAVNLIGLALQHARIKLHPRPGPLCSFLFAGPANIGKSEAAQIMAEHLFGHKSALLRVKLDKLQRPSSLCEIKVTTESENHYTTLFEAIQKRPYAVILLENINHAQPGTVELFQDILTQGYALDQHGHRYDFRHAIVIMTTTLGTERIISLTQPQTASETTETADLMQLILNENPHENAPRRQLLSAQELCSEIMPALETYFSIKILSHLNIVPFILLDYASVEKIIRLKLKQLTQQLEQNYGIELSYAPETIRFLVHETVWRHDSMRPIDKILEQHLYSCVAHELISRLDDKNRTKRLLLQLNDAGQLLRCEFVLPNDATLYS